MQKMTKKQAWEIFKAGYLPAVRREYEADGISDEGARAEEWGAFTDYLCKVGRITEYQYNSWSAPDALFPRSRKSIYPL